MQCIWCFLLQNKTMMDTAIYETQRKSVTQPTKLLIQIIPSSSSHPQVVGGNVEVTLCEPSHIY